MPFRIYRPTICAATLSGLSLVIASGAARATTSPITLQPVSVWEINYAEDTCRLSRTFGSGHDEVTLEFRQFAPGNGFELLVVGASFASSGKPLTLITEFEPEGRRFEDKSASTWRLQDGRGVIETDTSLLSPVAVTPQSTRAEIEIESKPLTYNRDGEANITALRVNGSVGHEIILQLGPMDKPMDAMRACIDDLLTHWGVDAAANRTLTRRAAPRGNPATWVTPSDYPAKRLLQRGHTQVRFHLLIDASGKPTSCGVQTPSDADFSQLTCDLMMRRAQFNPALDANGQPVASYYVSSVRWSSSN